jgi:hypothetical protein
MRLSIFVLTASLSVAIDIAAEAGTMTTDPKGFEGIPWGVTFSESENFVLVDDGSRIKGYELKQGTLQLGPATVDSMRFLTVNGQFGRVTVRYHGKDMHKRLLAYFQSKYGPLDRTPGQIAAGSVEQYNWRGAETDITMNYENARDRGIIFFESILLAPRFTEGIADTVN